VSIKVDRSPSPTSRPNLENVPKTKISFFRKWMDMVCDGMCINSMRPKSYCMMKWKEAEHLSARSHACFMRQCIQHSVKVRAMNRMLDKL